jgi:hypothetical protein
MNKKVRRDRKKKCLYCGRWFVPNKYTYATQDSCKSPECERAANAVRQQHFRDERKKDSSAYRAHLEAEAVRTKNNRLKNTHLPGHRSAVGRISHTDLMAVVVGQITALTGSQTSAECDEVIRTYKRKGRQLLRSGGE